MLKAGPYEEWLARWRGRRLRPIEYVEETESTNADAAELLGDERFGGRTSSPSIRARGTGAKGRTWLAPAGIGAALHDDLAARVATDTLWVVPFWVALAVRTALLDCGVDNDAALAQRSAARRCEKLAGILCHSSVTGRHAWVACGVGINVRRPGVEPASIRRPHSATTLRASSALRCCAASSAQYERSLDMLDNPSASSSRVGEAAPAFPESAIASARRRSRSRSMRLAQRLVRRWRPARRFATTASAKPLTLADARRVALGASYELLVARACRGAGRRSRRNAASCCRFRKSSSSSTSRSAR